MTTDTLSAGPKPAEASYVFSVERRDTRPNHDESLHDESLPRPAVEVENLEKHYGAVRAVDGISFSVAEGEIFGLLGHNGAGKTTTIRMLTGQTRPTSGVARIAGRDIFHQHEQVKPLINLVFEEQNLYERMTGRDNLRFFAGLYNLPQGRADEVLELVDVAHVAKRKVKQYSSGMKQRLVVARALMNKPRVLFLDEPTRGLDPVSARDLRQIIKRMSNTGTTVFLTTHYMDEADELCDRVAFLSQGRLIALDTPRELKLRLGRRSATVLLNTREEHDIELHNTADADQLADWMREGRVLTVHSHEGTLEDVFVALAGRPL